MFLYFEKQIKDYYYKDKNCIEYNIYLDETFFKGTFIELTEKYSILEPYKDSKEITDFINHYKKRMKKRIIEKLTIYFTFIKKIL